MDTAPALRHGQTADGPEPTPVDTLEIFAEPLEEIRDLVWVLSISHTHGENVSVHRTQDGAMSELIDYVAHNWPDDLSLTGDDLEDVDNYFGHNAFEESWTLVETEVQD